ncbi:integrase [Haemophilus paracuniculus]|uniref:Integrase n=1 Tax=Haemophilus paracuniculus TaxID=734 RepID=A0A1T0ARC9_9PAST|nr:tyrosine-type recombinase/integrase [Haemophilus paracuniculus]OOR98878.1 integrase [Haemophilus paracuniculus]
MAVRKDEKRGKWLADAYIDGKRIRRWFETKAEASRFFNTVKQRDSLFSQFVLQNSSSSEGERLSKLCQLWFDLHGQTLVNGKKTLNKLLLMANALGDPQGANFTAEHFAEYRKKRLQGEIIFRYAKTVTVETVNLEHKLLSAVFNELSRFGKWERPNPISDLNFFKTKEKELAFLRNDEIDRLLACAKLVSDDLLTVVSLCLATGARWSEIAELKASQLVPYKVTFIKTKSGKNRSVPIAEHLFKSIKLKQGKLFNVHSRDFERAINLAKIELPEGQLTHVLRHTFASHFMMNGGNILVLKDILGHSDIKMTMRYAHFAPSYLESAVALNPLANR